MSDDRQGLGHTSFPIQLYANMTAGEAGMYGDRGAGGGGEGVYAKQAFLHDLWEQTATDNRN